MLALDAHDVSVHALGTALCLDFSPGSAAACQSVKPCTDIHLLPC